MTTLNQTLDYFINHELENRLNYIELHNTDYINLRPFQLNNAESISNEILKKKLSLLETKIKTIKFKDYSKKESLTDRLHEIKCGKIDICDFRFKDFVKKEDYKYTKNYNEDAQKIESIIDDEGIYILYPVLANRSRKIPLMCFQIELRDDEILVNTYDIQIEALRTIVANILKIELSEVESIIEDFDDFHKSISSIKNNNILNIVEIIENEIISKFKNESFHIKDFKNFGSWAVTEEIILTMDSFGDMCFPPFQEELEALKESAGNNSSNLISKYLFGCDNRIKSDELYLKHYWGSYTSEYAVNEKQAKILSIYRDTDLLAVNGPPGTGKTTVLKEIIADSFVRKTIDLISVWDLPWENIGRDKQETKRSPLKGRCEYSILITSSNNNAIDNIGIELLKEIPFFHSVVKNNTDYKGIFCARLGRKSNMEEFKSCILNPMITYLEQEAEYDDDATQILVKDFSEIIRSLVVINQANHSYLTEREEVTMQLNDIKCLAAGWDENMISSSFAAIDQEINRLNNDLAENDKELNMLRQDERNCNKDISEMSCRLQRLNREIYEKQAVILKMKEINQSRFFKKFKLAKLENKYGNQSLLENEVMLMRKEAACVSDNYNHQLEISTKIKKNLEASIQNKNQTQQELQDLDGDKETIQRFYQLLDKFKLLQQKGISDVKWNDSACKFMNHMCIVNLRNQLFQLSLKITEAYICKYKEEILFNLRKVYPQYWLQPYYRASYQYDEYYSECLRALWESMFFCFPVMTTTFHAFDRKKFPLIEGIFDTILIDEAGQAPIHNAVTPLYRFRRAVIVGDVFQLEPVGKNNINVIDKSAVHEKHKSILDINENSVQHAADRGSFVYDMLHNNHVGIILNEHRRCEESIIAFSNEYVYDNALKIVKKDEPKAFLAANFVMLDVRGRKSRHNVNHAELLMCQKVIDKLVSMYGEAYKNKIGIIAPFKNQATELAKRFPDIDSGTVHVFQGKEKEVIIFTLVVDNLSRNKSGINFVGNKPNNLNVAFSRAKKQLILIGNYEACINANNYLSKAMSSLTRHGLLYSLYETELFEAQNIEQSYIRQYFELCSSVNESEYLNEIDSLIRNYSEQGVIVGASNHYQLLMDIMPKVNDSLMIVSPWIRSGVVNQEFLQALHDLHNKDRKIQITFGYHKQNFTLKEIDKIVQRDNFGNGLAKDIEAIQSLYNLLKDALLYRPPLHSKIVIVDHEIMIIGSHNWLSNKGASTQAKQETSCIIHDKEAINYVIERFFEKDIY